MGGVPRGSQTSRCWTAQAGTAGERITADVIDVTGDGQAGQTVAASKRSISNGNDALGNGHVTQAGAIAKRKTADADDGVWDGVTSAQTAWELNQSRVRL